ncbi:hypothetical protein NC653_022300 [Populus alba x Populus x berolinensis]|uniref:Uncharacterized protein n=1 Tax=Populus alba x Populus x berolinensis TaxID=444605 RepID=A0AAD6QAP4_9ROSI|nr:hypothetical protein NC653_022300 [Populus alba x Populus x berolinensis]
MTDVKPILCPPPGFYIVATTITGTWEVNRRRKKVKLSTDAIIDLPCPAILQLPLGLISLDIGSLVLPLDTPTILSDAFFGTSTRENPGNLWMIADCYYNAFGIGGQFVPLVMPSLLSKGPVGCCY